MARNDAVFPIAVVERRRSAACALQNLLRSAGFAPRHFVDIDAAAKEIDTPCLVLWAVPCERGNNAWRALIRKYAHALRLMVLADEMPHALQTEMLLAGVAGCMDAAQPWEEQLQALRDVAEGKRAFPPAVMSAGIDALRAPTPKAERRGRNELSAREREVVRHVALGESNREISRLLHLAEPTVKTHLQNIFRKLKVTSRVEVALYAVMHPERFDLQSQVVGAGVE